MSLLSNKLILYEILQCFDFTEIVKTGQVSKFWNKMSTDEIIWKYLLKRDICYQKLPIAYDICCIENFKYRETYKEIKNEITADELAQIGQSFFDVKPRTQESILQSCNSFLKSVLKGNIQYLTRVIDYSYYVDSKNPKIQQYLEKLDSYCDQKLEYDFNFYIIGYIYSKLSLYDQAKKYYLLGMKKKNDASLSCFIDGIGCCDDISKSVIQFDVHQSKDIQSIILWCDKALEYFPTRKYLMLYVIALRHPDFNKSLEMGLDCLNEYDKFMEEKTLFSCSNNVIERFHILKIIADAYCGIKNYKKSFHYWKQTIDHCNNKDTQYLFAVFTSTIEMAFKYLEKVDDAQIYITKVCNMITLSEPQADVIIRWQGKCMEKYIETYKTDKIIQHHEQIMNLKDKCKVSDHKSFSEEIYGYLTIAHFYQGNFGQGIETGLKGLTYRRNVRYLGKCYLAMKKFECALEYFSKYLEKDRNCTILLEFALFYLETDSNYFCIQTAQKFYLEALENKHSNYIFDQKETLETLEKRFKNHKRPRLE
jgi:tetratricopeptide (TPR) repeat protein